MAGVIPAIFLPIWQPTRKKTLARMGVDEIPDAKRNHFRLVVLGAFFVGVLSFTLFLGLYMSTRFGNLSPQLMAALRENYLLILAGFIALMFSISGFMMGIPRLHFYAAVTIGIFLVGSFLDMHPGYYFISLGIIILGFGAWQLHRFLRQFPA